MRTYCIQALKFHRVAILFAVIGGLIVAFPQMYFRIDNAELYQEGVEAIEMLPDSKWTPRLREIQDGHPSWGSIYWKEGKDDPYLFQPLGSMVVAYTGQLLGLGINNTILLSRLLFTVVAFLLIYSFGYLLSRDKLVALTSTSVILFAESILYPSGLRFILTGGLLQGESPLSFLEIARPVNSLMIFIFFFLFLVSFWLYYKRNTIKWGVLSAIFLGLNFYNYFYSWTFLFAFGGVLTVILLVQKEWQEARRVVYVFLGGLLVAVPYIWNLYSATQHPNYHDVALRYGVVVSREFHFIGVVSLCALLICLFWFPRTDKKKYVFSIALLLTPFITLNQQVITGKILQEGHYHWYAHKPLAVILTAITAFTLLNLWKIEYRFKRLFALCIILISFGIGLTIQAISYENDWEGRDGGHVAIERQKYAPVMHWLNTNAEKEAVVFGNEELSHITVIYTPLNVFHEISDQLMLSATNARLEDIVFTFYRLRGVSYENVDEVFYDHDEMVFLSSRLYGIYYREKTDGGTYKDMPDHVVNALIEKYRNTLTTPTPEWLEAVWRKYEVEYFVWDTLKDPSWDMDQYTFLELAATFGNLKIYRFAS